MSSSKEIIVPGANVVDPVTPNLNNTLRKLFAGDIPLDELSQDRSEEMDGLTLYEEDELLKEPASTNQQQLNVSKPQPVSSNSAASASATVVKKQRRKSRAAHRLSAIRICDFMKPLLESNTALTEDQQKSYNWATSFLKEYDEIVKSSKTITFKRDRSIEEAMDVDKRHKAEHTAWKPVLNIDRQPLSEIVKQSLKISIVDTSAPDWRICVENFGLIEKKLAFSMNEALRKGVKLAFSMNERYHGFRLILCNNQESLDFIKMSISSIGELWTGAKIEVKSLMELPAPPKIKFLVPDIGFTAEEELEHLTLMNASLPIKTWRQLRAGPVRKARKWVTFRVDEDSLKLLAERGNTILFTLRELPIHIIKNKPLGKDFAPADESEMEVEEESEDKTHDITPVLEDLTLNFEKEGDVTVIENEEH